MQIIKRVPAYSSVIERALHRKEGSLTASDVGSHWHDHFKGEASTNENVLLEQVISFFYLAEASGLGTFVVGRKGAPTRFEFDLDKLEDVNQAASGEIAGEADEPQAASSIPRRTGRDSAETHPPEPDKKLGQGIFIAHGKNKKPLLAILVIYHLRRINSKQKQWKF